MRNLKVGDDRSGSSSAVGGSPQTAACPLIADIRRGDFEQFHCGISDFRNWDRATIARCAGTNFPNDAIGPTRKASPGGLHVGI